MESDRLGSLATLKGITLASGCGTRFHPINRGISQQLMPLHDRPMICYPLSALVMAGTREVLIITTPHDLEQFERQLLGDIHLWLIDAELSDLAGPLVTPRRSARSSGTGAPPYRPG